jgi:hypothetical protein
LILFHPIPEKNQDILDWGVPAEKKEGGELLEDIVTSVK